MFHLDSEEIQSGFLRLGDIDERLDEIISRKTQWFKISKMVSLSKIKHFQQIKMPQKLWVGVSEIYFTQTPSNHFYGLCKKLSEKPFGKS